jgi:hypothetical protein
MLLVEEKEKACVEKSHVGEIVAPSKGDIFIIILDILKPKGGDGGAVLYL